MSNLRIWLTVNRLILNESRTKLIDFYRKHRHFPTFPRITLGDHTVECVDSFNFLGLHLGESLTRNFQFNQFVKLLSRFIEFLYSLKCQINWSSLLLSYISVVYPNITCFLSMWGSTIKQVFTEQSVSREDKNYKASRKPGL